MKLFDKSLDLADRIQMGISMVIRAVLVVAIIQGAATGNWAVVFVSLLALVLTIVPLLWAGRYNVKLPIDFELAIVLFIYAAIFLGTVRGYYQRFWWWDAFLHTGSGFALGFIGFLILYLLYAQKKLQASPFLMAFFAWAFALALGAAWEIFEYSIDGLFGTNMQRSGLPDTMADLIVDALGALFASGIGYIYLKQNIWDPFDGAIRKFLATNPRFKGKASRRGSA
ncbi:MAG TPA: hypothetical protein VK963_00105 [Candidatus Saccharimonadales bacterium]|nr:hypothetical protein [Candidatus Saccharimonadales bacterium]